MLCPNCETENRDSAKFCDECGFPLAGLADRETADAVEDPVDGREPGPDEEGDGGSDIDLDLDPVLDPDPNPDTDDLVSDTQELYDIERFGDLSEYAPGTNHDEPEGDSERTDEADLTGLEVAVDDYGEKLVDSSYEVPKPSWRDGNTIQMAPVEGSDQEKSKDYLASSTRKQNNGRRIAVIAIVAVIAAAAAIALVTFQMHLWGGKTVPDVRGMTEADAISVLEGEGFAVRSSMVKSDDTEGLVLISDPEAGSRANDGSEVLIHIASARVVPNDIVGMSKEKAQAALAEEGFENVKFEAESSEKPEGQVLSVTPEPGTRAKSAAEIVVKIAQPYVVPDVSSMYLDDAIAALQEAGYGYDVTYVVSETYPEGMMLGTSPAAGTQEPPGTVVYIQIAQARGTMLEGLARSAVGPGTTVVVNGTSFVIDSLDSVSYVGNGTVSYTATGRAFTSLAGETVYGSPTTISSVLTFSEDNQLIG